MCTRALGNSQREELAWLEALPFPAPQTMAGMPASRFRPDYLQQVTRTQEGLTRQHPLFPESCPGLGVSPVHLGGVLPWVLALGMRPAFEAPPSD